MIIYRQPSNTVINCFRFIQTENYVYQLHKRESYKETETVKFRFGARKRYIDKSFTTSIQTASGSYFAEGQDLIL